MRKTILAALALATLAAPAHAQLKLNVNTNDPVTGLAPAEWEQLVGSLLNVQALVGDPGVMIVSSMPVPITVTCDKWTLVGTNVYKSVQGNPTELRPFSVTYIKTKEFDGILQARRHRALRYRPDDRRKADQQRRMIHKCHDNPLQRRQVETPENGSLRLDRWGQFPEGKDDGFRKWRVWVGAVLFIAAELTLFGAAEGPQKWQWIMTGTVPDFLLALGFIIL